jgi:hypothetical protein
MLSGSSSVPPVKCRILPRLGHDHFLPSSIQCIIQCSAYQSALCDLVDISQNGPRVVPSLQCSCGTCVSTADGLSALQTSTCCVSFQTTELPVSTATVIVGRSGSETQPHPSAPPPLLPPQPTTLRLSRDVTARKSRVYLRCQPVLPSQSMILTSSDETTFLNNQRMNLQK